MVYYALDFLAAIDVQLAAYPLQSLGFAPCNRFVFTFVWTKLKGKRFQGAEKAVYSSSVCDFEHIPVNADRQTDRQTDRQGQRDTGT